jgi:hypothetical protein
MRARGLATAGSVLVVTACTVLFGLTPREGQSQTTLPEVSSNALRPVSAFANIGDPRTRAVALFEEAGKVLTHARCVNCHPASDRPRQTDARRPHQPLVVRGVDGHGAPGMECATCHHADNFDPAQVPGHPQWHLAPASMAWEERSLGEICEQIKDPARNGGKDMAALLHHMGEDSLVGWAWSPGAGRTAAPGTQAEFGALVRAWADAGAHCPAQ